MVTDCRAKFLRRVIAVSQFETFLTTERHWCEKDAKKRSVEWNDASVKLGMNFAARRYMLITRKVAANLYTSTLPIPKQFTNEKRTKLVFLFMLQKILSYYVLRVDVYIEVAFSRRC